MSEFSPIAYIDGYLPIADHGLIGDGTTAALVGRDGAISWLCLPRFDSPPLFCRLLDAQRGGAFLVAPEGAVESRQYYEPDTPVLVTEMRTSHAWVRITDTLTLRQGADLKEDAAAGRAELLRMVEVVQGDPRLTIEIAPFGETRAEPIGGGLRIRCSTRPELEIQMVSSLPLSNLRSVIPLHMGDRLHMSMRWSGGSGRHQPISPEASLEATIRAWQAWTANLQYEGPRKSLVHRSAITLKLLDHFESGAIVAAPTSSLPESLGGPRNWDYRYSWVRDAAFSVYALQRIGCPEEAAGYLGWVLNAVERSGRPRVLYNLDGRLPQAETIDPVLSGYRASAPVRWGNAAADQIQHDVYGEILDCAYQWAAHHGRIDEALWNKLHKLIESAAQEWHTPDQGIWEVRTPGRPFTYSAALCQVALDRGARIAERFHLPGDVKGWRIKAEAIRQIILSEAWDEKKNSLVEHLGGGGVDASLLSLPLRRVLSADHPRMTATVRAITERLGAGHGLLYRYLPHESPDGIAGHEGAFLLCSFWLVENLAYQGKLHEARDLFDSLCDRANPLGLLPEQIDPASGAFLGNFPQAFSHVGLISSAVNLARLERSQNADSPKG